MSSITKTALACLAILAVGVAGFWILKVTKPAPKERRAEKAKPIVRVVDVKKGDFRAFIRESGNVEPKTSLDIIAEVSGRIVFVSPNLRIGYFVEKGELLVEIDPREYRLSVAQNKAQITQLKAEMATIGQERENIMRNIEVEKQKLELSKAELNRKRKLLDTNALAQSEVDKQAIDTKQKETSVVNQENALNLLQSRQDLVEAKIEATKAQLDIAKLKLEHTKIHSPFNGRVFEESVEPGQYVSVNQKLATVYDVSAVEVVINVSPDKMVRWISREESKEKFPRTPDISEVNQWMRKYGPTGEVRFHVGGIERTWPAKVSRVKGALDITTRTIPVVVEVKDPFKGVQPGISPPLVPGMFVDVVLNGRLFKDVAQIPRAAVHEGSVYLVEDGKLKIQPVKVELMTRNLAIISKGLKNGDKVILTPISVPLPGTELRVASK